MIGETRMYKLGGDPFKRVNVDYAIPRHSGTDLVLPNRDRGGNMVFRSLTERPGQLRGFTPFDERTVKIGIIFAAAQYLEYKQLKKPTLQFTRLVTSEENRAYWDEVETDPPDAWNRSVKNLEDDDYRRPIGESKEAIARYEAEKGKVEKSWKTLREKAVNTASKKAGVQPRTVDRGIAMDRGIAVDRGMRSIPEPGTRSMPVASRAQRKADKAARKKNAPKGRRNCMAAGLRWLCCGCCGIFRRR